MVVDDSSTSVGVVGGEVSRIVGECWNEPDGLARDFRMGIGAGLASSSPPLLPLLLALVCREDIGGAF
jgi:hypothetical protein